MDTPTQEAKNTLERDYYTIFDAPDGRYVTYWGWTEECKGGLSFLSLDTVEAPLEQVMRRFGTVGEWMALYNNTVLDLEQSAEPCDSDLPSKFFWNDGAGTCLNPTEVTHDTPAGNYWCPSGSYHMRSRNFSADRDAAYEMSGTGSVSKRR